MRSSFAFLLMAAALLPACGNIFPPQPVQTFRDPDKEEDVRPMTPSQDPGIETTFCGSSTCGNTRWEVHFVLSTPAATSGWVVQEISYDRNITGGEHVQGHFWEGFYVKAGATRGNYAPGPDDTYGDGNHPDNSKGTSTVIGKAKFYEGTLPADFVRFNPDTKAAERRSTTIQPPFWVGTGTDHNLTVTWDCTAGNDITTMQPTPDPTGFCP